MTSFDFQQFYLFEPISPSPSGDADGGGDPCHSTDYEFPTWRSMQASDIWQK